MKKAPTATNTGGPVRQSIQATGRTWTCPCPHRSGRSRTTPGPTATPWHVSTSTRPRAARVADRPQFREMIEEGSQPSSPFEVIFTLRFVLDL